jgi:hypothetical protein
MPNIISEAYETYSEHLKLVLLFSIPFLIAFAIPLLAPLPTYISTGAIFLRTASVFINPNIFSLIIIIVSLILSLLFISFAFVSISLIVKAKKTHVNVGRRVLNDIEKYIGKVFTVFLTYAVILILLDLVGYYYGLQEILTPLFGFILFAIIFYVPSAIVVDNKRISRAVVDSARLLGHSPQYFLLWVILFTIIVSILDVIFIGIGGNVWGPYIMLIVTSVVVLPYFVIFQAHAYMRRFPLLSH